MHLNSKPEGKKYLFWVASSGLFETSLIFYSSPNQKKEHIAQGLLYDSDGNHVNSLEYSFHSDKASVFEISSLMEGVKYEAGLKHGILDLKVSADMNVICRLHSHSAASLLSSLHELGRNEKAFLPLRFSTDTKIIAAVVNLSKEVNQVRCKLFIGKRTPEINLDLPPQSVRLISMNEEFIDCLEGKSVTAAGYVRISSRNDMPFAAQIVECVEGSKNEAIFSSIL